MEKIIGMKHVKCATQIEDSRLQDNLCECIRILGGEPRINDNNISVDYEGKNALKMVELFEQFSQHEIRAN